MYKFLISFFLAAMAASASVAAPSDDCNQTADMDLRIRGCTQFIKSSKDAKQIAIAYFLRGTRIAKSRPTTWRSMTSTPRCRKAPPTRTPIGCADIPT